MKRTFYCELSFVFGIIILAFGASLMEKADFGLSMIVAPAYVIHLWVSQFLPFYTFGMSEYVFQGLLLILLSVVMRKLKVSYFLSLVTAVIYGFILDMMMAIVALIPFQGIAWQIAFYVVGLVTCSTGVALLFRTYFIPEAYELVVTELTKKYKVSLAKTKTIYDCCSCILSIVLSFLFFGFGKFEGIGWGTIVSAVFNGWLIGRIGRLLEKKFVFKDALPLRDKLR